MKKQFTFTIIATILLLVFQTSPLLVLLTQITQIAPVAMRVTARIALIEVKTWWALLAISV